jgi:phospholipid/cholesterol/gamma-HCH transport system permease protein
MPVTPRAAVKEVQDISVLAVKAFTSIFRRPYYFRDILHQMDQIGVGSLSVIMLTGFFTGAVLTLQTSKSLARFGATGLTGQLVALSLVRELGPVLSSLMVAGRVGSGIASELGSMLATTSMLPMLTMVANAIGLMGGLFIAVFFLNLNPNLYLNSAWNGLSYMDLFGGLLKPLVFGATVAIVGCHCGLRTYGGTQGVGRSTTQAVVAASILILVFNLILTKLILEFT